MFTCGLCKKDHRDLYMRYTQCCRQPVCFSCDQKHSCKSVDEVAGETAASFATEHEREIALEAEKEAAAKQEVDAMFVCLLRDLGERIKARGVKSVFTRQRMSYSLLPTTPYAVKVLAGRLKTGLPILPFIFADVHCDNASVMYTIQLKADPRDAHIEKFGPFQNRAAYVNGSSVCPPSISPMD